MTAAARGSCRPSTSETPRSYRTLVEGYTAARMPASAVTGLLGVPW